EVGYRVVIGRSYYAVYWACANHFKFYNTDTSAHQNLINTLGRSNDIELKKLSKKLEIIFKQRKKADYRLREDVIEQEANLAIQEAKTIFEILENTSDN